MNTTQITAGLRAWDKAHPSEQDLLQIVQTLGALVKHSSSISNPVSAFVANALTDLACDIEGLLMDAADEVAPGIDLPEQGGYFATIGASDQPSFGR